MVGMKTLTKTNRGDVSTSWEVPHLRITTVGGAPWTPMATLRIRGLSDKRETTTGGRNKEDRLFTGTKRQDLLEYQYRLIEFSFVSEAWYRAAHGLEGLGIPPSVMGTPPDA